MFKYCLIKLRKGGGVVAVFLMLLSFSEMNTVLAHSIESTGSEEKSLNLDSTQDVLNVSDVLNKVVGEVVNDLTPTDLFNTGTNLPLNLPLNPLNHIKGFGINAIDTDTTDLDLTRFFSPAGVSSNDLLGILKGAAILSIQIFIVVVQVVSGIVKGLLGALQ